MSLVGSFSPRPPGRRFVNYGFKGSNVDKSTGYAYGIVNKGSLPEWVYDEGESIYTVTCPECLVNWSSNENKPCECVVDVSDCLWGDEPVQVFDLEDFKGELDGQGDLWIFKSSYVSQGTPCSPCAPGAVNVDLERRFEDGVWAYSLPPEWWVEVKAPETLARVEPLLPAVLA